MRRSRAWNAPRRLSSTRCVEKNDARRGGVRSGSDGGNLRNTQTASGQGRGKAIMRRRPGTGCITTYGYFRLATNGNKKNEHLVVAEKALGKPLPRGVIVHHHDKIRTNNAPDNLVICPNQKYHKLLHQRMDAVAACGIAHWRKCWLCQQYDDPKNLYIGSRKVHHSRCENARQRQKKRSNHVNHV